MCPSRFQILSTWQWRLIITTYVQAHHFSNWMLRLPKTHICLVKIQWIYMPCTHKLEEICLWKACFSWWNLPPLVWGQLALVGFPCVEIQRTPVPIQSSRTSSSPWPQLCSFSSDFLGLPMAFMKGSRSHLSSPTLKQPRQSSALLYVPQPLPSPSSVDLAHNWVTEPVTQHSKSYVTTLRTKGV